MIRALVFEGEVVRYTEAPPQEGDLTAVHPSKPHLVPVEIIDPGYDPVTQVKEKAVIVYDDRVVWDFQLRNKNVDEWALALADRIAEVKAEAQRRIFAIMPAYQQTNWLAKKAEMDIVHGAFQNWPPEAKALVATTLPLWKEIEIIRARSNAIEAVMDGMSLTDLANYDINAAFDGDIHA